MSDKATRWFGEFSVGESFQTYRRTVTEADVVLFTSLIGLQEEIFLDHTAHQGERLVPGVLALSYAEGLVAQLGLLRRSGRAFVGVDDLLFRSPVFVGDTLWCDVAVTAESTSRSGKQGRVVFSVNVSTDRSQDVITYSATRLIAAREPLAEGNDQ